MKMSELDSDRQQIERLTDVVPPPSFAITAGASPYMPTMSMHLTADDCDAATREQLAIALKFIDRLKGDLLECREYLEDFSDVNDGDYGSPEPNRAMRLISMIDESLNGRPY